MTLSGRQTKHAAIAPLLVMLSGGPLTGDLAGDYSPNRIHAVNVNLIWRF